MTDSFKTITLVGSMRFFESHMLPAASQLSKDGWIVLAPFAAFTAAEQMTDPAKVMLDQMHLKKIDMSEAILVVNPGGYIGPSTGREIRYAVKQGKAIMSLEPIPEKWGVQG